MRTRLITSGQVHPENLREPGPAGRGELQRPRVGLPHEPTQLQAPPPDRGADNAGQVIAALAPIETWPAKNSPRPGLCRQVRTEAGQKVRARLRQLAAIVGENDMAFGNERVRDSDPEMAGQSVT